jgi:hypothetical protein
MGRRSAYLAVAALATLPRFVVLVLERDETLSDFVEKSDTFAQTLVESGTYGFIPGVPSAYTQPAYGLVLAAVYGTAGRSWLTVGVTNIALALAATLLVYELGRRLLGPRVGLVAAALVALNPYLVWHDVHLNREVLDGVLAAGLTLLVVLAAERASVPLAAAAGAVAGFAILANSRLALLPLLLAAFVVWRVGERRHAAVAAVALVLVAAVTAAPWIVRNRVEVGCAALTTDARALWKANNTQTDELLARGRWIDAAVPPPGRQLTPEAAGDIYRQDGRIVRIDECEEMRFFRGEVLDFWREHPGEKAELAARGAWMLWDPRVTTTEGNPGAGSWLDFARTWLGGAYFTAVFALALLGLPRLARPFAVLAVGLLAYQTLMAMAFVGATRYRAPWDFLLLVAAAAAVVAGRDRLRARRETNV